MSGAMTLRKIVIATTRSHVLSVRKEEEMSMTNNTGRLKAIPRLTGIERQELDEAQAKLERMRYERTHFSDGVPVELYEGLEPEVRDDC